MKNVINLLSELSWAPWKFISCCVYTQALWVCIGELLGGGWQGWGVELFPLWNS
jgi:hypothetical protein